MRVLLVRPISKKMPVIIPNLGLGYLASALSKDKNNEVSILDCAKERINLYDFIARIKIIKPDLVGFQLFSCDYSSVKEMARATKKELPDAILIAGGPHPSALPELTLEEIKELDFVFFGEAETGLPLLVSRLKEDKKTGLDDIPGLAFRDKGKIILGKKPEPLDVTRIPFPRWDLIDPRTYPPAPHGTFTRRLPFAPIITSRGCPFSCRYCAMHLTNGRKWRKRDILEVIDEIEVLVKDYEVKEVHIEDDNFTLDKERVFKFCELLKERKLNISWAIPNGVRLDTLDEKLVKAMEDSGCYSMAVGIESSSEKFQTMMCRKVSVALLEEKVRLVARVSKIRMTGYFILGYPGESLKEMEETIKFALKLPLARVQFSNFLPLPGTDIYQELVNKKEIDPKKINWDLYLDNRIVYSPYGISEKKLRKIMRKGFAKFYFRPHIVWGLLKEINSFSQFKIVLWRMIDVFR